MSKTGFSTYVNERFSGFEGRSEFQADDVADFPELAMRLFNTDVPLRDIIGEVLKVNAGTIYVEGANARHGHEWRVFEEVELPDDKSVILGVIDVKSNCVEHPRLVADRLVRLGKIVGKERLLGGTDCGFDTFIRASRSWIRAWPG
jgi:methionine synthase II (cobalamin-independent)